MLEVPVDIVFERTPLDPRQLTRGEAAQLEVLGSEQRATEWLRGRAALREVLARQGAEPDTSRLSFPSAAYSLSHAGTLAVAAGVGAAESGVTGVGIDFEPVRSLRQACARFFLAGDELAWLTALHRKRHGAELLRLWTVKEALFKADPRNAGRTLRDYRLLAPEERTGRAVTPDSMHQSYASTSTQGGILSVAVTRGGTSC